MNNELNLEDYKNLQVFLQRVQITGNEALPLVLLQQKVAQILTPLPPTAKEELGKLHYGEKPKE
jgi:hypothetical protein